MKASIFLIVVVSIIGLNIRIWDHEAQKKSDREKIEVIQFLKKAQELPIDTDGLIEWDELDEEQILLGADKSELTEEERKAIEEWVNQKLNKGKKSHEKIFNDGNIVRLY